jgi:hypothetical protein
MIEVDRAGALYKIRTALGWTATTVAARLDVTSRTVGMWETGTQPIPDGRWRLFLHEVKAEIERHRELVVVFADDGMTPLDVVSDANFFRLRVDKAHGIGIISSYAIDRFTGNARLHQQRFPLDGNDHVLRAADHWRQALEEGTNTGESEMLAVHRWLTRRVLQAEEANPKLRELKNQIAATNRDVELTAEASDEVRSEKLQALDQAIWNLINEVERFKRT